MVKLVWTTNNLVFSRLIRWGLEEPVSHFAIVMDEKIVYQSNLLGTHWTGYKKFRKGTNIVLEIPIVTSLTDEEFIYQRLLEGEGSPYEFGGFFYFCWRVLLKKLFGMPIPDRSAWGSKKAYFCYEVADMLPEWVTGGVKTQGTLMSPYQLYLAIARYRLQYGKAAS